MRFNDLYMANYERFGLPRPAIDEWYPTKPTNDTIYKDFAKYLKPLNWTPDPYVYKQTERVFRQYLRRFGKHPIWSYQEAKDDIDKTKASGFPFRFKYPTKQQVYDNLDDFIRETIQGIKQGDLPVAYWEILGKEELRPVLKIILDKVRSMNGGPFVHNHGNTMIWGAFLKAMLKFPFHYTHTTVGWAPQYGGWHELMMYFGLIKLADGDFTKWDSSILYQLARLIWDCCWDENIQDEYKTVENERLRDWLFNEEFISVCVLPDGTLVLVLHGVKSGSKTTLPFNSLLNLFGILYAFLYHLYHNCHLDIEKITFDWIEAILKFIVHGDDNLLGEDKKYGFDHKHHAEYVHHLGMTMDPWEGPYKYAWECTYLSMNTITLKTKHGDYYIPIPNKDRLSVSLAIDKPSMSTEDYIQKLDTLMVLCIGDYKLAERIRNMRNMLIELEGKTHLYDSVHTLEQAAEMMLMDYHTELLM